MPETGILSAEQQAIFDQIRTRVLEAQGALQASLEDDDEDTESYEPFEVDFKTVGEFYHKIETGFISIPQEDLFIGPPEAQANARFVDLNGDLISVVDRASACAAIERIVEQGEAPTSAHPDAHFWVFDNVRIQYAAAMAQAEQSGIPFEPVRPVVSNPMTHFYDDTSGGIVIHDPLTHTVADLFNVAYDTMLLMLLRFFAHTEEMEAELEHLSRATLRLMTTVIRPLGEVLTKMPVDRASLPGRTAGPGFGYNRDVHLLPHKPSAWVFFGERLWQLATAATKLRLNPTIPTEIQEATAVLQDLACLFAPSDGPRGVAAKVAELKAMEIGLGCTVQASLNVLFLNMLLLMSVVLIPFVTTLLTSYLNQQEEKTAALMYSGTFLLTTILFNVLWGYAAGHQRLLRPEIDPQVIRKLTRRYLLAPLLYLFSLPRTQVNVKACLVLYILVALFYTLPADRLQVEQRNDTSQERMNCTSWDEKKGEATDDT